ncbi:MAG: glutamate--tRNA ligase [Candidatus Desulfofervidus auxilii]|nr:glutamate--tRNA ligase [Candidatus Desulfofervidus auxilii]
MIITRFPPSPTGYLHIGGARTALFNWLFARHHKGKFILRIEDTDKVRSKKEYVEDIIEGLKWLGLNWDEGPYFQSERLNIYKEHIERLLSEGKAYYCHCSPEELERKRQKALAQGKKPRYDGTCRYKNLPPKPGAVVRFKSNLVGETILNDLIHGPIIFNNAELDDWIIQRSDGTPTYNFVVVVDDALMGITHVIRGDDHINNTPKQLQLYQALGYKPPQFAHVPMILGPDKSKLSKRHGASSILEYREKGFLPQALVNFLVRLGWSYGDQEIFSLEELIEKFDISRIGKSPAIFNFEKLLWLNAHYIKELKDENLAELLIPFLNKKNYPPTPKDYVIKVVRTLNTRAKTLEEMAEMADFYFLPEPKYDSKAVEKFLIPEIKPALEEMLSAIIEMPVLDELKLEKTFRNIQEKYGLKPRNFAQAIRVSLTGRTVSPGLFEIMVVLGKERVIERLKKGINLLNKQYEL